MSLLHKNGVISGLVELYCLPCEVRLGTESDAKVHIADPTHKENLDSTSYLDKHEGDGIRKVPQGYYCEYCNKLFYTKVNVFLHVSEGEHLRKRDSGWLREEGDAVVVLNQLVVDSDSWHGLVDGACALCNTEYLDKDAHKTISTHLLKMIQSTVELHTSGAIYRKGNDYFHCLICNAVFPLKSFGTHFEQRDHVELYNECCKSFNNITAHVNINSKHASKVNIEIDRNNKNAEDIKEFSNTKPKENKLVFEEETNMTVETEGPIITGEETLYEDTGESMIQKGCPKDKEISGVQVTHNEIVSETHTSEINEINTVIATENFEIQKQTDIVHEAAQESIANKSCENVTLNDKDILQQPTNNEQVSEGETNKNYKNYCEVIITTPEMFYTLQTNDISMEHFQTEDAPEISHETVEGKITKKKNENLNCEDILKRQEFQTKQYPEISQETNEHVVLEKEIESDTFNDTEIIQQQSIKNEISTEGATNATQNQKTETFQEHCVPNNEGEIESVSGKEISGQKFLNNEDAIENLENKSNENNSVTSEQSYKSEQSTENNIISEKQFSNNEDTIENLENRSNDNHLATSEQCFECVQSTEDNIVQKIMQMSISKKEKSKLISNENKIRYKQGYTRAFCSICQTNIPSSLKNIERHVTSKVHRNEARRIFKFTSNIMPTQEFVQEVMLIKSEQLITYVVINNRYLIDLLSYLLMTTHHSYIRCHLCELNFNVGLFDDHQRSATHNSALAKIPVLLSQPSEFVREVQPGFYHCGFCNRYEGSWQGLRDHCKSLVHLQQKSINSLRLKDILTHSNQ